MAEQYVNGARTILAEALDGSETGVDVDDASAFPTTGDFRILVVAADGSNPELMKVTSVSGDTFTVVRAAEEYNGSSSTSTHGIGDLVLSVLTVDSLPTGGGSTIQYGSLKPAPPTYDFAAASLDGAFSVNSSQGSFGTGNIFTQAKDGSHACLAFNAQMGAMYVSHGDTDLDFHVGGLQLEHVEAAGNAGVMVGIAALNSSGSGIGVLAYTDAHQYLVDISSWNYNSFSATATMKGMMWNNNIALSGPMSMRLKRISGTWTGYWSKDDQNWNAFSTRADSYTVDRLAVGLFYTTSQPYWGKVYVDYFHVTT